MQKSHLEGQRGPGPLGPNRDQRTSLHSGPAPVALGAAAIPLALSAALVEGIGTEGGGDAWLPVLPPADGDGRLPTRNGARLRMADPAALAAARFPRTRGDRPLTRQATATLTVVPPHTRG